MLSVECVLLCALYLRSDVQVDDTFDFQYDEVRMKYEHQAAFLLAMEIVSKMRTTDENTYDDDIFISRFGDNPEGLERYKKLIIQMIDEVDFPETRRTVLELEMKEDQKTKEKVFYIYTCGFSFDSYSFLCLVDK